ncbi:MAG: bifunctional glutamate N-acetyltransferase/amino-acid acetyltransferase ArgJ [Lachnospiraceae bacterium]|nr:bifunctional glutamate N-acetyltransferase/amino-acid acetyltransferase ArgJ [Lachnospiraceae bacterium]
MKKIDGGVTAAKGFKAASVRAGIKESSTKTDMAMVYSESPCAVAGTFTKNKVKAAPVKWDQHIVYDCKVAQAVVCNSGVANACTGKQGMDYCEQMADATAEALGIAKESVLVASTGVIGAQLPMDKICNGIKELAPKLSEDLEAGHDAAVAIMTTDTRPKEVAYEFEIGGKKVVVGGMCKGSGMIHPNMCTMLGFITTDINISQELLQEALSEDIKDTFNMVSVDGDTSTNDTVLLMANKEAGNEIITEKNDDYYKFVEALHNVNVFLCRNIAGDGEGATALLEVKIVGAKSTEQAKILSKSVVTSSLVKAMICGHDSNCGRIMCALGYAETELDPDTVDLFYESNAGKLKIVENGVPTDYDEEFATKILSECEVTVIADVKMGECEATAWGCDLTHDYVSINADYRS